MLSKDVIFSIYILTPFLILACTPFIIFLISALKKDNLNNKLINLVGNITIFSLFISGIILVFHFLDIKNPLLLFYKAISYNSFIILCCIFSIIMGLLTTLNCWNELLKNNEYNIGIECFAFLILSIFGSQIVILANDLFLALVGIEILSFSIYLLCTFNNENLRFLEGTLKYFILGAIASTFFIFGIISIYGATKTIYIDEIIQNISLNTITLNGNFIISLLIGFIMITCALFFKIAIFPFHSWLLDVYDSATLSINGFMTYFVKAIIFIFMFKLYSIGFISLNKYFIPIFTIITIITMTFANITALFQTNIKRMLAYSTIAHSAYILIAIISLSNNSKEIILESGTNILFYLISYFLINLLIFTILLTYYKSKEIYQLEDFKGYAYNHPILASLFSFALLSLAGLPITSGFFAKFFIFYQAFTLNHYILILFALFNSFISFYYYIKLIMQMYMYKPETNDKISILNPSYNFCITFSTIGLIILSLLPQPILAFIKLILTNSLIN